jgi:hypothetical protein
VERASSDDESQRIISQNHKTTLKVQRSQVQVQVVQEGESEDAEVQELEWDEERDRVTPVKKSGDESFHEDSGEEEGEMSRGEADVSQLLFHDREIGKNKRRALVVAESEDERSGDGNASDVSEYREMGEFIVFGEVEEPETVSRKKRRGVPLQSQRRSGEDRNLRRIIQDSDEEDEDN